MQLYSTAAKGGCWLQVTVYVSFYVEATNRDAFMSVKQDLLLAFIDCVDRNGAKLAKQRLEVFPWTHIVTFHLLLCTTILLTFLLLCSSVLSLTSKETQLTIISHRRWKWRQRRCLQGSDRLRKT